MRDSTTTKFGLIKKSNAKKDATATADAEKLTTTSNSLPTLHSGSDGRSEAADGSYYQPLSPPQDSDALLNDVWEVLPSSPEPATATPKRRNRQKSMSSFYNPWKNSQQESQSQRQLSSSFSALSDTPTVSNTTAWMPLPQWLSPTPQNNNPNANSHQRKREIQTPLLKNEDTITTTPLLTHLLHCLNNRLPLYCNELSKGSTVSTAANAARELEKPPPLPPSSSSNQQRQQGTKAENSSSSPPFLQVEATRSLSGLQPSIPKPSPIFSSTGPALKSPFSTLSSKSEPCPPLHRPTARPRKKQHLRQRQKNKANPKNNRTKVPSSKNTKTAPTTSPTTSALALSMAKAEWDRFTSPLILLAGAEALYVSLEHLSPQQQQQQQNDPYQEESCSNTITSSATELVSIYEKINQDLTIVSEILCDPFLVTINKTSSSSSSPKQQQHQSNQTDSSSSNVKRITKEQQLTQKEGTSTPESPLPDVIAATSVSQALSVISKIVTARCELIAIHADAISAKNDIDRFDNGIVGGSEKKDHTGNSSDSMNAKETEVHDDESDGYNSQRHEIVPLSPSSSSSSSSSSRLLTLSKRCDTIASSLSNIDALKNNTSSSEKNNDDDTDETDSNASKRALSAMVQNIIHETKALSAALASIYYLERCSFFETILNARKFKVQLGHLTPFHTGAPTVVQAWMRVVLTRLISCMSIVFDRIEAYSSLSRGFQTNGFQCCNKNNSGSITIGGGEPTIGDDDSNQRLGDSNIDSAILDFVCEQQDKGGPPLAVAAILNVECGSSLEFEQGFILPEDRDVREEEAKEYDSEGFTVDGVDGIRSWPAVYMRTTLCSTTLDDSQHAECSGNTATMGKPQGNRQGSKLTQAIMKLTGELHLSQGQDEDKQGSKSSLLRSPSASSSNAGGARTVSLHDAESSKDGQVKRFNNQDGPVDPKAKKREYGPTGGEEDWPHSEWPNLISVLMDDARRCFTPAASANHGMPQFGAFTYREHSHQSKSQKNSAFFVSSESISKQIIAGSEQDMTKGSSLTSLFSAGKIPSVLSFISMAESGPSDTSLTKATSFQPSRSIPESKETSPDRTGKVPRRPSFSILEYTPQPSLPSAYHAVRLGSKLWMVVIVKVEEEKWHRRKIKGYTDEEIRLFLNNMASKVSLRGALSVDAVAMARKSAPQVELCSFEKNTTLTNLWKSGRWQETEMHQFLNSMKSMLGLKPNSPRLEPLKSPYVARSGGPSRKNIRSQRKYRHQGSSSFESINAGFDFGVMALFLGPELIKFFPTTV